MSSCCTSEPQRGAGGAGGMAVDVGVPLAGWQMLGEVGVLAQKLACSASGLTHSCPGTCLSPTCPAPRAALAAWGEAAALLVCGFWASSFVLRLGTCRAGALDAGAARL